MFLFFGGSREYRAPPTPKPDIATTACSTWALQVKELKNAHDTVQNAKIMVVIIFRFRLVYAFF